MHFTNLSKQNYVEPHERFESPFVLLRSDRQLLLYAPYYRPGRGVNITINQAEAAENQYRCRSIMDYFKPLMSWLEEQNKGRQIGWE
jgi:Angiotensin-converting enzyme